MPNVAFERLEVTEAKKIWREVRDCVKGERAVKAGKTLYLPALKVSDDPRENELRYAAYLQRAVFYGVTGRTLSGLVGQVFSKEPTIELPSSLEMFEKDVDGAGTTLIQQMKAVTSDDIATGRGGLLADFPKLEPGQVATRADLESGKIRPRVVFYPAENIINWREEVRGGEVILSLLVLTESKEIREDEFEFKSEPRWRVLRLRDGQATVTIYREATTEEKAKGADYIEEDPEALLLGQNGQPLDFIPFCFVGSLNNDSTVDDSPLYPIASLNISHYRNSADVEESSFLVGQPTPYFAGLTQPWVDDNFANGVFLGSRSAVPLPQGGSAGLLQASPNTLPSELMKSKEEQMRSLGAKLVEEKKVPETATGAAIAETSEASVLGSIAQNVAQAYSKVIWYAGLFLDSNLSEDSIEVEISTDFDIAKMTAQERQQLMAEWQGEAITFEEMRDALKQTGIAYLSDEDAKAAIESEAAMRGRFVEDAQGVPADDGGV